MEKQESLLRIITAEDGREYVECRSSGTESCRHIHKGCEGCPVMKNIINRLNEYETELIAAGKASMYKPLTMRNDDGQIICILGEGVNANLAVMAMLNEFERFGAVDG